MSEIEKENLENKDINTSNIFDEFEVDDSVKEELEEYTKQKDSYYYIDKIADIFKYLNFILIFVIIIGGLYVYIQTSKSDFFKEKAYLNPICKVLNGENIEPGKIGNDCSGLANSLSLLDEKIKQKEIYYLKKIIPILKDSYEIESVKNSKEALFLIDKKQNKNDPLNILNEFDLLKNKFLPIDKSKIKCNTIIINDNKLIAKCSAFSPSWYDNIPKDNLSSKTEGTSITLANSFIDFLGKSKKFRLLDKQKIFEKKPYFGEGEDTFKTDFNLVLEYNKNNLPLN